MIPTAEVTLVTCNNTQIPACAYVAVVATELLEDGAASISKLVAYVQSIVEQEIRSIVFDGITYLVSNRKDLVQTCGSKFEAFRIILSGCEACDGTLYSHLAVDDCDDDSEDTNVGTPVVFGARHLVTKTQVVNDQVLHLETHELTFEGRPVLTSENMVVGCGVTYKIKEVRNQDDIRKPLRALAEVTPLPRATV